MNHRNSCKTIPAAQLSYFQSNSAAVMPCFQKELCFHLHPKPEILFQELTVHYHFVDTHISICGIQMSARITSESSLFSASIFKKMHFEIVVNISNQVVDSETWRINCAKTTQIGKVITKLNIIPFSLWNFYQYFSCTVLVSNIRT